jgi:hypothetical protein
MVLPTNKENDMSDIQELEQHKTVSDTRQSVWTRRRTFVVAGHKVRTTVHMDPYKFQSDFYVEVFSAASLSWNRVHTESSDDWYDTLHALSSARLTGSQLEHLDSLEMHMVMNARDLLI